VWEGWLGRKEGHVCASVCASVCVHVGVGVDVGAGVRSKKKSIVRVGSGFHFFQGATSECHICVYTYTCMYVHF